MVLSALPLVNEKESAKFSQKNLEILATITHEIRNPLNAIIGLTHLLQTSPSEEDQKVYSESLMETSENLLELINNIMDFSKVQSGKLQVLAKPTDLKNSVAQNLLSQKAIAQHKGLHLNLEIDQQIPELVMIDSVKLNQVLLNLVSNALKFTETGSITVSVDVEEILKSKARMRFRVIDSGIGIPSEKLNSIFEAFDQGGEEINRVYGGTGLGLSISRKIIAAMGGILMVQSEAGNGSEFSFSLDLEIAGAEDIELQDKDYTIPQKSLYRPLKVLVVDDNKLNILIVQKYLELWGWGHETAHNGLEAVEKVQDQDFDIILMDLHMPEMDGLKAVGIIRKLVGSKYQELPIIGLTASIGKFVEEKVRSAGFTDLIMKPFNPKELQEKIISHSKYKKQAIPLH